MHICIHTHINITYIHRYIYLSAHRQACNYYLFIFTLQTVEAKSPRGGAGGVWGKQNKGWVLLSGSWIRNRMSESPWSCPNYSLYHIDDDIIISDSREVQTRYAWTVHIVDKGLLLYKWSKIVGKLQLKCIRQACAILTWNICVKCMCYYTVEASMAQVLNMNMKVCSLAMILNKGMTHARSS